MTGRPHLDRHRTLVRLGALLGLSVALAACRSSGDELATTDVPDDYRLRHPIAVTEADRSIVIFVGQGRGGLTAPQRADVIALARTWVGEGTGAVIAEVPVGTPNARAASATYHEIRSLLAAGGVPAHAITQRDYRPDDPRALGTIRLSYPRITAVAGPCGLWPEDLGPSIDDVGYNRNKPYYNLGCASQRNLAAMIDNPADLERPRAETPAYGPRRDAAFQRYRKGDSTTTSYPEADKAKLSDTGK